MSKQQIVVTVYEKGAAVDLPAVLVRASGKQRALVLTDQGKALLASLRDA